MGDAWQDENIPLIWQPLKDGGLGYTSAAHVARVAALASWRQNAAKILHNLDCDDVETLLQTCPRIAAQIQHY